MILDIEYNDTKGSSLKIMAKELPAIPAAKKRETSITIPGRDGTIYITDGAYESTEIKVKFNFIEMEDKWDERWGVAKKWLAPRNKHLKFSSDPEHFYKISKVELEDAEHTSARICNFTAAFKTTDGLRYLEAGQNEHTIDEVTWNPYEISYPIYKIYGEGMCELVMNGKCMTANVGQNLIIDTERKIAYREDGTLINTTVKGNYDELLLMEGENKISITAGFDFRIIPNWRCL